MLHQLIRYGREHELGAEPGFQVKEVRWALHCDAAGRFLALVPLGEGREGRRLRCPHLSQPEIKRGGAGCRHFLVDNAAVVTGFDPKLDPDADAKAAAKLGAKHAFFLDLLRRAAAATPELPALAAAARCLEEPESLAEIRGRMAELGVKPTDNVTFAVGSGQAAGGIAYPVESGAWHGWWRQFRATLARPAAKGTKGGKARARCLASGELVEPALTHPKVRGLAGVGGLATGDVWSGYKQDSFRSYGLAQSANAPLSEEMAAAYTTALNHLIRESGQRLADAMVVHWFRDKVAPEDDPIAFLQLGDEPRHEREAGAGLRARRLLTALREGRRPDLAGNRYYALTLRGASGRVMVLDWMEGPFPELAANVEAWFDHLEIVRRDGAGLAPAPKFLAVAGALVRDLGDLPAPALARLWRVAVRGEAVPEQFLAQALLRSRADVLGDRPALHARLALLKAFHLRLAKEGDPRMKPTLDPEHPSAAYQCGRLLAVLAALQYNALGNVGAGVVQRYYAAASATPALVLGRLLRGAQFHLHKLDPPLARWYDGRVAEVMNRLGSEGGLPATLDLREQSLFALGYYHQIAADRAPRSTPSDEPHEEN